MVARVDQNRSNSYCSVSSSGGGGGKEVYYAGQCLNSVALKLEYKGLCYYIV